MSFTLKKKKKKKIRAVLTFNCARVCFVCVSESSPPKKSKEIFHSKTTPSAAQYIYSTGGVALPSLLHLHLPSVLLCI